MTDNLENDVSHTDEQVSQLKDEADNETCPTPEGDETCSSSQWEEEREVLVNQVLRLKADFENYKRRNEALVTNLKETANEQLITQLLPVVDNFKLALDSIPTDSSYCAGVKMINEQLLECLINNGLEPIGAVGQVFDPNVHEAVSVDGDTNGELIVTTELKQGYFYQGKLIRAAMVQVAAKKQEEE